MEIEEAIAHAKRGDAVLFTGAGFSFGARNMHAQPDNFIPNARDFANELANKVGSANSYDLPIIAQYFCRKKGEHSLVDELIRNFSATEVQDYHIYIASLPWKRVYTTNYDNVFEFAAHQSGKEWTPITLEVGPTASHRRCVHINGHINNLSIKTLGAQVKLTHSSYSADAFAESPWSQQLRQDLNAAKAIVYIGYSMADIDISRVLFTSPELRRKTVFIVGPQDDDITIAPLEDYGEVHRIGVQAFSELAKNVEAPESFSKHEYTWLKRYSVPDIPLKPGDKEAIELLTMGVAEDANIAWAVNDPANLYCVARTDVELILRELDRGKKWFLLHSDLGNGKSLIKQNLTYTLAKRDYKVFWDTEFDLNRKSDLSHLGKEDGKVAVFIDETPDRFEVIDGLLSINHPNITVFTCVRSTLYELGESSYNKYLPEGYIPFDVNQLSNQDIANFVRILNSLGLWGGRASESDWAKANFIEIECRRGIAKLILSVFEESEIGRRITRAASTLINSRTDVASLIVLSFLLNRINHSPNPTVMSDIMGKDAWQLVKSDQFKDAGEFIRFQDGVIKARSSIVSAYLLRKALSAENLVWYLERFVRRMGKMKRDSTMHHIFVELQRFPVLESLIESKRKREIIIGYFESIKEIPYNERRALFWLHYAMARLSYGEFDEATLYFTHAKSLAKGNVKDTIEVNNHFARLLLDSRTESADYDDYFKAFEMAHGILLEQMNKGTNKHFPYRQAANYVKFISFRKRDLNDAEVKRFVVSCKQVVSAIDHLRGTISHSNEVQACREAMSRAIAIATGDEATA